ncbi:unnamed protein product [Protopolystoma xenopodis]|uniref:Major facilitator superfamily (MFS) profile domain-containing protein n=1 Tax=Protopolystoma xenopodis TaxID=117903 RepID=A0A448X9Y1_9PLAT|nr:unnamed protein product [Protopolystoma xenopodis]
MSTVGTIPGFVGVSLTGYILEKTHKWSVVFYVTSALNIIGGLFYLGYGSAEAIV